MSVFLIDTDTASDDAVALIMALRSPGVEVVAITTVSGNVHVDQATRNALYTLEICGATVPVYSGAEGPISRPHEPAHWFHGRDGLGDQGYPMPVASAAAGSAAEVIVETIHAHPGLTLVTLGPLTNISLALDIDPSIASKVGRCVVMGGAPCCEGNVTPAAEYNIWVDPEAARRVFGSGLPVEMVGWQLCRGSAVLNDNDIAGILKLNTAVAQFAIDCNSRARQAYFDQTGENGISLPDPVAMAIALDRSIGTSWSRHYTEVETGSELTRGMTVVDRLNVGGDERNQAVWGEIRRGGPNVDVCWSIDADRWKKLLFSVLA